MLGKKILLVLLGMNIFLSVLFSFANALSTREVNEQSFMPSLINEVEEETKEKKGELENEKTLISSPFSIFYIMNH